MHTKTTQRPFVKVDYPCVVDLGRGGNHRVGNGYECLSDGDACAVKVNVLLPVAQNLASVHTSHCVGVPHCRKTVSSLSRCIAPSAVFELEAVDERVEVCIGLLVSVELVLVLSECTPVSDVVAKDMV